MELVELSRFFVSLLFVIGLIFAVAWLVKRVGIEKRWTYKLKPSSRLHIIDSLMIDPRRRLVLIKRDDKEHLILIGTSGEQLIETIEDVSGNNDADDA